ncbi:B-cell receptor CD22-like [Salarias fasciatus]|uniref:B-cell receptor CD22-like n=1 Tax=Salarias fasciatus TaxID=181472 RepID=UPI001176A570|nr:B-cell receptor CD22-like [Salarias fasciatus]
MKDQQIVPGQTSKTFSNRWYSDANVSCGLTGQKYRSPSVMVNNHYEVMYDETEICALKGSTVEISCSYRYPTRIDNQKTRVKHTFWFRKLPSGVLLDLKNDSDYSRRVRYGGGEKNCTLIISNLTERDSAEYKFRFVTNQLRGKMTGSPGVKLSVSDPQLQIRVRKSISHPDNLKWIELTCQTSCQLSDPPSYIWFKNGEKFAEKKKNYVLLQPFSFPDSYHCAIQQHERFPSPPVDAPKPPSVSVSPSGEIVEGSSVTLTCSSDANPAASYSWYKAQQFIQDGVQLVFQSIQSSESGQYSCMAEYELMWSKSEGTWIDVEHAPKPPSVSVSPSGEIVEGSSVTLTCSSDANPAASYSWYRGNQTLSEEQNGLLHFTSISYKDRGNYYCQSKNHHGQTNSTLQYLDVQYAPKLLSVSVSPSGRIIEGHSVNLTCSSDANPAAHYSWYREGEDTPKASGQTFTITDSRSEHSGMYYCEAQNRRGRLNSTLHLVIEPAVFPDKPKLVAVGILLAVFLLTATLCAFRKWKTPNSLFQLGEEPDSSERQQEDLHYATIRFVRPQTDSINSTITTAGTSRQTQQEQVDVVYAAVNIHQASSSTKHFHQDPLEDPSALYSTVKKIQRTSCEDLNQVKTAELLN